MFFIAKVYEIIDRKISQHIDKKPAFHLTVISQQQQFLFFSAYQCSKARNKTKKVTNSPCADRAVGRPLDMENFGDSSGVKGIRI